MLARLRVLSAENQDVVEPDPKVVRCPFIDANGKFCPGSIVRIEAYRADLSWEQASNGGWEFSVGEPRSHYHLFCSVGGSHAGTRGEDDPHMKFNFFDLPPGLRQIARPDEAVTVGCPS